MRIFTYLGTKGGNRSVMKFCIGEGSPT